MTWNNLPGWDGLLRRGFYCSRPPGGEGRFFDQCPKDIFRGRGHFHCNKLFDQLDFQMSKHFGPNSSFLKFIKEQFANN